MASTVTIQIQQQAVTFSKELTIALLGGTFLAIMSQVAFPIPFTPIPVTLQTLALFLLAGFLGSKRATTSVISYLAQGTIGLPVFAGGMANPLWFIDPKAGFFVSFVVAAFIIGKLLEKRANLSFLSILSALTLGQAVVFVLGAGWLSMYVGLNKAIAFGIVPFIGGSVVKIIAGAFALKARSLFAR